MGQTIRICNETFRNYRNGAAISIKSTDSLKSDMLGPEMVFHVRYVGKLSRAFTWLYQQEFTLEQPFTGVGFY